MNINKFVETIKSLAYQENAYQQLPKEVEDFKREKSTTIGEWERGIYANSNRGHFIVVDIFIDEDKLEIERIEGFSNEESAYNLKALEIKRERKRISFD